MNIEAAARLAKERVPANSFARKVKVFLQCPASSVRNAIPGLGRLGQKCLERAKKGNRAFSWLFAHYLLTIHWRRGAFRASYENNAKLAYKTFARAQGSARIRR